MFLESGLTELLEIKTLLSMYFSYSQRFLDPELFLIISNYIGDT